MFFVYQLVITVIISSIAAREIVFPPVYGLASQEVLGHGGSIDVTASAFAGLTTYANIPYVHCLAKDDQIEKFDIAILGAPFDTVSIILLDAHFKHL